MEHRTPGLDPRPARAASPVPLAPPWVLPVLGKALALGLAAVLAACSTPRALVVAAVSCESRIRDVEFNLRRIEHWAREAAAAGADLVLFPECSIHGWWQSMENRALAEPLDGPSVLRLVRLAGELDVVLAVGLTEIENGHAYITHVLLEGDGVLGRHRKSALAGGPGGEAAVWDCGDDANVFTVMGHRVGIAICFESVEPETCAALRDAGANVILAPYANGTGPAEIRDPARRQRPWIWERVRENGVWYVACDATPHRADGSLRPGAAFVIDPAGRLVACSPEDGSGEAMVVHAIPPTSSTDPIDPEDTP